MEHILIDCDAPGCKEIWTLAQKLWLMKNHQWPEISLGLILGCGTAEFHDSDNKRNTGLERLYRIIISESAFLIWKLRCERVIQLGTEENTWHSELEIQSRWIAVINQRLKLDQAMTNHKYTKKTLPRKLVLATWNGTLKNRQDLPPDWVGIPGVLVGISTPEHRQTRRGDG